MTKRKDQKVSYSASMATFQVIETPMVVCVVIDCVCRFSCGSFYGWFVLTFVVDCAALFRIPGVLGYCDNRTVATSFRILLAYFDS